MTHVANTTLKVHPELSNEKARQNALNTAKSPKKQLEGYCGRIGGLLEAEILRQKQAQAKQKTAASTASRKDKTAIFAEILASEVAIKAILASCKDSTIEHDIYPATLLAILEKLELGEVANMQDIYTTKIENIEISVNFIRQKIKPLLVELGLLIKINEKSYRWLNAHELNLMNKKLCSLDLMNKLMNTKLVKACRLDLINVSIKKVNRQITLVEKKRAAKNPYIKINKDGVAQKIRKPFTGELTEEEKQAIRQADKEKAFKKILGKNGLSQQASLEIQQLRDKTALEIAQKQAAWDKNKETAKQWGAILAVVLLVIFVVTAFQAPEVEVKTPKQQALGL